MKIAITSLITKAISRHSFGGTEVFTYNLIESLVARGHEVTLYASSDSQTSAKLKSVTDSQTAQRETPFAKLSFPYYLLLSRELALDAQKYDLIHNNFFNTYLFSAFAPFVHKPIVHTIHSTHFLNADWAKILRAYGWGLNERLVFVSERAKKMAGQLPNSSVIHTGIDTEKYLFNASPSDYCLWLGRMVPEKGASLAIRAALKGNFKLFMQSKVVNREQQNYFDQHITPNLGANILYSESPSMEKKIAAYQMAKVFLFPLELEEPLSLVMLESMACGTPVVAFARGAVPEAIRDGETGFIVNPSDEDIRGEWIIKKTGVEGISEAMERLYSLAANKYRAMRQACRDHVEKHFDIKTMVTKYISLYRQLVKNNVT